MECSHPRTIKVLSSDYICRLHVSLLVIVECKICLAVIICTIKWHCFLAMPLLTGKIGWRLICQFRDIVLEGIRELDTICLACWSIQIVSWNFLELNNPRIFFVFVLWFSLLSHFNFGQWSMNLIGYLSIDLCLKFLYNIQFPFSKKTSSLLSYLNQKCYCA